MALQKYFQPLTKSSRMPITLTRARLKNDEPGRSDRIALVHAKRQAVDRKRFTITSRPAEASPALRKDGAREPTPRHWSGLQRCRQARSSSDNLGERLREHAAPFDARDVFRRR